MESRASRYYGYPFQGSQGVTQGYPLSPRILNYVVNAIVCNQVGLVVENKAIPDRFGYTVAQKSVLFYTENSLLVYINLVWLHWGYNALTDIFELVELRTNVVNTVVMVCQPVTISGRHSTAAYDRRMTREGYPCLEKQFRKVVWGD